MKYLKLLSFLIIFQLTACANNATNVENSPLPVLGNFVIERNVQNNTISYLKLKPSTQKHSQSLNPQATSLAFLQKHRSDFLIDNPNNEFKVSSVKKDSLGFTQVKLDQVYMGLPVWNGAISMQFNRENNLQLVKGQYYPSPSSLDVNAGLDQTDLFKRLAPSVNYAAYKAEKIIYFVSNMPRLAYVLKPKQQTNFIGHELIVDALTAQTLNKMSSIQTLR